MPLEPKLVKPDRRNVKLDPSKKKETKSGSKPTVPLKDSLKNEKYRSGSVDRRDLNQTRDASNIRQSRSIDRLQRPSGSTTTDMSKTKLLVKSTDKEKKIAITKTTSKDLTKTPVKAKPESQTNASKRDAVSKSKARLENPLTPTRALSIKQSPVRSRPHDIKASTNRKPSESSNRQPPNRKTSESSNRQPSNRKTSENSKRQSLNRKTSESSTSQLSHTLSKKIKSTKEVVYVKDSPTHGAEKEPIVRPRTSTIRKGPLPEEQADLSLGGHGDHGVTDSLDATFEDSSNIKSKSKRNEEKIEGASNVEEDAENSYEDDFEEYESDFEDSDSESLEGSSENKSDNEDSAEMSTSEGEETSFSRADIEHATGLLLHPTIVKRQPVAASKNTERTSRREFLRMSDRSSTFLVKDSRDNSPVRSKMKTSRSFINFASAKLEQEKQQLSNKVLKRGMELLELITLDEVSFDIIDIPPMKYDVYIRSFGRSNAKQVYVQTENYEEEEIQTDEIDTKEKWTQHPPNDRLGVGGDCTPESASGDWKSHFKMHTVMLNNFLQNIGPVILSLLNEELPSLSLKQITEKRTDMVISRGFYKLQPLPFCKDMPVIHLNYSTGPGNYLISVHNNLAKLPSSITTLEEKGIICVWNLGDITRPECVLIANSQPTCACFGPGVDNTIVAGMVDGAVMLWDLTESSSFHAQYNLQNVDICLRSPTFNTAAVIGEDPHRSCIVSVQAVHYSSRQIELMNGLSKDLAKSFHVLSLEDMGILNVWVVIEVLKPDKSGLESDLGLAPGGRLKLVRSSTLLLYSPNTLPLDLKNGVRTFDFRTFPSDSNHLLITTDAGMVLHVTRHSGNAIPKYYSCDSGLSLDIRCISCSPHCDTLFLVGCSDGSVILYTVKSTLPLMVLPQAARGEPIISIQWSSNQPAMFYLLDSVSTVHLWNLHENTTTPQYSYHFSNSKVLCFSLSGDHGNRLKSTQDSLSQMAVANENGEIEVHAIQSNISSIDTAIYDAQMKFMLSL